MADIILVVVGLVIVLASFVISGNSESEEEAQRKNEEPPVMTREMLEACLVPLNAEINHRFDVKFEERWEETIADADDQMSQISNEKIMAVNDFSAEVLEKINQSHSDVVFLYKMLTDKEDELKQLLAQIRKERKELEEYHEIVLMEKKQQEEEVAEPPRPSEDDINQRFHERLINYREVKEDPIIIQTEKLKRNRPKKTKETDNYNNSMNINAEIIRLYQLGESVKEISKHLNRGQGEVKLVVDLYTRNQARI